MAVGAAPPEAEEEAPPLVREPVEVPVAEAPVPVAEPEVAVAVTKPDELAVTVEMSGDLVS